MEQIKKEKRNRAKKYLKQIMKYCDEIKLREEGLRELNASLAYKAKGYAAGGVQTSVNMDGLCRDVVKYLMDEDEYRECIQKLKDLKEQIIKEIYSLPEPLHCQILAVKYVKRIESFWEISEVMNYSYSHVRHLHKEALESFYDNVLSKKGLE